MLEFLLHVPTLNSNNGLSGGLLGVHRYSTPRRMLCMV